MVSLPKPDVILTHESDLDGFVGGLLLQRLATKMFRTTIPLEAYHYDTWRQRPPKESSAWVCDFNYDPRLDKANWFIVDHHPAAARPAQATLRHDLTKSASLLCYELCQEHGLGSPALDRIVRLSHVADLFLFQDADFDLAIDYASLVKVYQFWNLHAIIGGELERLLDHPLLEVMAVKRRIEDPLGLAWSKNHVVEISREVGFVESIVGNSNLIVHRLLHEENTSYRVLITLLRKANGCMVTSLRSRNGEALGIAEKLQGGGHANAAGATLPRSVQRTTDAIDYLRKVLNPLPWERMSLNSLESLFDAIEIKS